MSSDPEQQQYADLLHYCLAQTAQRGGSDLHVRPNEPPFMRQNGRLVPIPETRPLSDPELRGMAVQLTSRNPARLHEFDEHGEADLSYELAGVARFRVNLFRERGRIAMTLRVIPTDVPQIDDIGVPPVLKDLALAGHGLILVTGATGSGKTTTLAAMIDHINRTTQKHILTIEDPIEIVHPNHQSLISQREVGTDTGDFKQALRRALRQDPDVILIGEIRDEETMRTALAAAETGHLVLATLHTINAAETIARVLDLFPPDFEKQARAMLAGALQGVISQRLARTTDGKRTAVVEVMVHTARIADCINNPEETGKLTEAIAAGEYYGMQTFDQALIKLIMDGRVTEDEAMHHVSSPQNFRLMLESTKAQRAVDEQKAAEEAARHAVIAQQQPDAQQPEANYTHAAQQASAEHGHAAQPGDAVLVPTAAVATPDLIAPQSVPGMPAPAPEAAPAYAAPVDGAGMAPPPAPPAVPVPAAAAVPAPPPPPPPAA